jgi:hypothetical protein
MMCSVLRLNRHTIGPGSTFPRVLAQLVEDRALRALGCTCIVQTLLSDGARLLTLNVLPARIDAASARLTP